MRDVYLDHYAANPVLPDVLDAMLPFFSIDFGNPSSLHTRGDIAKQAVEEAREQVASLISAPAEGLLFTSSGTEANNLAIKGIAGSARKKGNHIVASNIEHFSVLNSIATLEKAGYESTLVEVDEFGMVDPEAVKAAIRDETVLVSCERRDRDDRAHQGDRGDRARAGGALPHRRRGCRGVRSA
jgi:cysteine desulfurase